MALAAGLDEGGVEQEIRLLLACRLAADVRWVERWKKEHDRYFRGKPATIVDTKRKGIERKDKVG